MKRKELPNDTYCLRKKQTLFTLCAHCFTFWSWTHMASNFFCMLCVFFGFVLKANDRKQKILRGECYSSFITNSENSFVMLIKYRHIKTAVLTVRMSHVRTSTHRSLFSVIWVMVAQLLEHLTRDQKVAGSIPVWGWEIFFLVSDKAWSVVSNLPLNYMYSVEILVHAFVSSKLDYCNSLLYNIPKYVLNKLQFVQNAAVRLITCSR